MATVGDLSTLPTQEYIEDLIWGGYWNQSSEPITFSFPPSGDYVYSTTLGYDVFSYTWTTEERVTLFLAMDAISSVADVNFTYTIDWAFADILYFSVDSFDIGGSSVLGMSGIPGFNTPGTEVLVDTLFNWEPFSWLYLDKGGYGFNTILHEMLHSLGLAHPHDNGGYSGLFPGVSGASDTGTHGLNQSIFTIMSYVDGSYTPDSSTYAYGYAAGPMAFDIAALHYLYGANMSTATGNNTYKLPSANTTGTYWSCIWDAGGTDTISNQGSNLGAVIDLRAATLIANDPNAGGFISKASGIFGGYTIANGAVIEKAIGGNANDQLIGNTIANTLSGLSGNDQLVGNSGNDTLIGGSGKDTLLGGSGTDSLKGGSGNDRASGGLGSDKLIGGSGADTLKGEAGNDKLFGGTFSDQLFGHSGNDLLKGDQGNDVLNGGSGNDNLFGHSGNDVLNGGGGNDRLFGGSLNDRLIGGTGKDFLSGDAGNDRVFGGAFNDKLFGGAGRDTLKGEAGNDTLKGDAGNDRIIGGAGTDLCILTGRKSGYTFNKVNKNTVKVIADNKSFGTDLLTGVEKIKFTGGGTFDIDDLLS